MAMTKMTGTEVNKIASTRNLTAAEHTAFRDYLRDEYGTGHLPQAVDDALYGKAWENGHSSGYSEVEYVYGDLADLIILAHTTR